MDFKPLRDHILQLAISGQIVPQLDSEPEVKQIGPAPEKVPFAIPEKWKWVQIGEVFSMQAGKYIRASQIADSGLYPCYGGNGLRGYVASFNVSGTYNLIGRQGALCGNIHLVSGDFYATEHAVVAKHSDVIDPRCAYYFLISLNLNQYATATAQPGLAVSKIAKVYCPLPPIAEQQRIAAIVDDLFAHLEQMEAAYSEFAGPMTEHFRNTALQMAISGQLLPQLDSEPEVKQIGPAPEKVPFAIPEKWKWVQLNSVGQIVGGGTPSSTISEYWENPAIVWITPTDLGKVDGAYISEGARGISQLGLNKSSARLIPAGSVIYTSRGACIGDLAIATKECCTNQGCKSLVPDIALITSKWAYYALKHATPTIRNLSSGTTFAEISGKKLGNVWIPLPPLAEQRRIVAKLEDLFSGVDKLGSLVAFT